MKLTQHGQYLYQLSKWTAFNCYLLREEDGLTLIDTGMSGSADAILKAAAEIGQTIRRILLTHVHGDHVGSLDALHARLPEVPVLVGAREARLLARDMSLLPEEAQSPLRGSYPQVSTRPTQLLQDGDQVGMLRVVASPGHTPGHLAFFDERDSSLIAGDAFATKFGTVVAGKLNWLFPFPGLATWHKATALESARQLSALNPSRLAVGHGPVLEEPAPAMRKAVQQLAEALA